ncbi:hypothetical protein [Lysinibacillus boronitolerans]|uniref:hypothetical protein n=1 Tax=Lysinibacillus boronitolerans TaxID=309788 RepID=UPI0028A2B872|nr:hypothetical protein [Bacillus mobilis]
MKQVKFNLYVDQHKIRTLDELKENFNIDDILDWYEQGVLQKWLNVRNYHEQLEKIRKINSQDLLEIASEIISIFNFTEEQSKAALDSVNYRLNYAKQHEISSNDNALLIEKYHIRYEEIKNMLLERVK